MIRRIIPFMGMALLFTGCSLAPQYSRPQAPVPAGLPDGPAYENIKATSSAPAACDIPWREFFTDNRMQRVIETALENNRDLRVAALKVERARALYRIQRSELLPKVYGDGSGGKQRLPADLSGTGRSETFEQYSVGLGVASWEIDFFGRIRSLKQKALQEFLSTEQARHAAEILLVSEVANAYLSLAADREDLNLALSTLDSQKGSYDLIERRYEVGVAQMLELRQAQTRVDAARVDVALYTQLAARDENALNLLAGSRVEPELLPDSLDDVRPPKDISFTISSEVLLTRPDVLQAENFLKSANANIGAARAAFFPRISLTTAFGTASGELSGLFKAGSASWNFAPQIGLPIFDPGVWSQLKVSKVERKIAVAEYEKAIQTAFREVADALAQRGTVEEQLEAQSSLVDAAAETCRLSNALYTKGIDSYLGVLDSQRSLYASRQGLISVRLARFTNLVKLYAVLGGGASSTVVSYNNSGSDFDTEKSG